MRRDVTARRKKELDILGGPILPTVVRFMIPLVLATLLQVLYNAADIVVLGRFASIDAQASVSATGSINSLIVSFSVAVSIGAKIILARSLGAKDHARAERVVSTAAVFGLLLGTVFLFVGELVAQPLLVATACPPENIDGALLYMRITFLGCPAVFLYNTLAEVLRTKGDTRRPLNYLAVSGLLNVLLNVLFVAGIGIGVAGVAIATIASQYLSLFLVLGRLTTLPDGDPCRLCLRRLIFSFAEMKRMIRFGVPSAISALMYPIANLQIQAAINSYGSAAIAGNSAAGSIEGFISAATGALSAATVTFIGQSMGAGDRERVRAVSSRLYIFGVLLTLGLEVPVLLLGRQFLSLYVAGNAAAIEFGYVRVLCNVTFYFIPAIMNVNGGHLQAFGFTLFSMLSNIIGICGFRMLWMNFVYPHYETPLMLMVCFAISWGIVAIVGSAFTAYLMRRYKKGKNYQV